jgi:hypothetical protein
VSDITLNGYVQKRRGVLQHLVDGRMTPNEYFVFDILLILADHNTGCGKINASAIVFWSGGQLGVDGADRALRSLDKKNYIVRETSAGRMGLYPYRIQNYEIFWRDAKGAEHVRRTRFDRKTNKTETFDELLECFGAQPAEATAGGNAEGTEEGTAEQGAEEIAEVTTIDKEQGTKDKNVGGEDMRGATTDRGPEPSKRDHANDLMHHFYDLLGTPASHKGKDRAWVDLILKLPGTPARIREVMDWALENETWARAITAVKKFDPMEYFSQKFITIEAGMEGDKVFAEKREKRLRKLAAQTKHAGQAASTNADKPLYRQVPGDQIVNKSKVEKF